MTTPLEQADEKRTFWKILTPPITCVEPDIQHVRTSVGNA
jgi:hypothetical protein